MTRLGTLVRAAAVVVLLICVYAFLLGQKIHEGKFENDPIGWYFLAKGIFCSLSLYLSLLILQALTSARKP